LADNVAALRTGALRPKIVLATSLRKAAILLDSLPAETARELSSRLSPRELAVLQREIDRRPAISSDERAATLKEFLSSAADDTEQPALVGVESAPLADLDRFGAERLLSLLASERSQTIALVLSRLPSPLAADILARLPEDARSTMSRRISTILPVNDLIARDVERALEEQAAALGRASHAPDDFGGTPIYGSQRLVA
jgi:flagellar motor switch protein FliG